MERFGRLLLDVWREACRNTPIAEGIAASASDLFARLPVDFVLVRRLDSRRRSAETVATGVCHSGPLPGQLRSELMPEAWERLLEWCAKGQGELLEPGPEGTGDDFATLDKIMACHIEAALRRSHGRIEGRFGAAKLLQINPHTLRGRMRSLGVDWRRFRAKGEIGACR